MFADTDFLLALVKKEDWLKKNALQILKEYGNAITTSLSCLLELAIVCQRLHISVAEAFVDIFELLPITQEQKKQCLQASLFIEEEHLSVFDAFHATACGKDSIISSDQVYDRIGLKRIPLEKN